MKSFKAIMSEVAQPKSPEEKKFKDMHSYETKSHPVAPDAVFTGAIGADDLPREKAKRKADQEGDANYDKQFKTEEAINELDKKTLGSYIKKAHSDKDTQVAKDKHYQAKGDTMDRDDDMYHQWGKANKAAKKAKNRTAGIAKAADKLTREELELEISEDLKMVSRQEHPKGGHIVTLQDKNGKKIVRHLNKGKVTDMKSEEAVDEGSIKGSGTDRKSVLKKAFRSGEQDTRQFNTPGGAATNKPKRGSDATVKKAYQAGRDSEQGDSAYKGTRRSKPQDTLGYKKNEAVDEGILDNIKKTVKEDYTASSEKSQFGGHRAHLKNKEGKTSYLGGKSYKKPEHAAGEAQVYQDSYSKGRGGNERAADKAVSDYRNKNKKHMHESQDLDEGILDNIKKKVNDVRRKVVGPNQAEKDAARKKMMARQRASTMKNIGSAMGAVAKKDKAAEVARLKQGLKNVENQRKESVELDETTQSALMKPVTTTTPDGKKRTVMKTVKNNRTDDHGQDIIKSESGVNPLIKAVTGGKQKIKEALKANILESLAQADVKETE